MLATLITRCFQIIFGAVVLGLSIAATKWQEYGSAPATTGYSAFAGAFGILAALIGIAAVFVDAIPDIIQTGIDGLASVIFLAGGIAFAVGLKGISCGNPYTTALNDLTNGGCAGKGDKKVCGFPVDNYKGVLSGRCRQVEADAAFLFLGFIACVAAAVLCFMGSRRSGKGRHSAV